MFDIIYIALLYDYIDSLKNVIVKKADGKDGDVNNIEHQDDLEAAIFCTTVLLFRDSDC